MGVVVVARRGHVLFECWAFSKCGFDVVAVVGADYLDVVEADVFGG